MLTSDAVHPRPSVRPASGAAAAAAPSELIGKRITGYHQLAAQRRFIHDRRVLDAIVADLKAQAPDHIAVTGDIANIALAAEFRARPRLACWPRTGARRELRARQSRHLCRARPRSYAAQASGARYMSGDDGGAGFPYLRAARGAGADRAFDRRADARRSWRPARSATRQARRTFRAARATASAQACSACC